MVFVPGYDKAAVVVERCDRFRRERVTVAMKLFELAWYERFGKSESVKANLRNIMMIFSEEPNVVHAAYDMSGAYVENAILIGETISKDMIWVYVDPAVSRICDTSLVHELVHASIWADGQHKGDPDHLGGKYPGWTSSHNEMIEELNSALCVLGI